LQLAEACRCYVGRRLRGQAACREVLSSGDQVAFIPLPEVTLNACRQRFTKTASPSMACFVDNYSLVRETGDMTARFIRP
jgi:hypothetical protein